MDQKKLVNIVEGALFAAGRPLTIDSILSLFPEEAQPDREEIRAALSELGESCVDRGIELKEVKSGFRLQVKEEFSAWISKLWEERPPRYSRALLETMALIAYKQPITRAEIEEVRGVSVSTNIVKTLLERDWVRVVGHRDVPGRPALYATTRSFLDYFNMKGLEDLPSLAEIRDIETINAELDLDEGIPAQLEQSETDQAASMEEGEGRGGDEDVEVESREAEVMVASDENIVPIKEPQDAAS